MDRLVSLEDYEKRALKILPKFSGDYYRGGAGNENTLKWNKSDFNNFRIRGRCLRNVSKRDTSVEIFGTKVSFPCGIAPTALHKMAHPDGEVATAKAAQSENVVAIFSSCSTTTIEEIAAASPNLIRWLQTFIYKDRNLTESLVKRAENSGFKAIVLTIDCPLLGLRRRDMRNNFSLPENLSMANFESKLQSQDVVAYLEQQLDQSITWEDVKWIIKFTKLPVILKGVMTKEDARKAVEIGAKAIIISNHGARQLDQVPSTIEVLPEIAAEIKDEIPIFLDGGIRQGTDLFITLALGAKMVFIGRPVIYGLACEGQKGVENIFKILKSELDLTMCIAGANSLENIKKEMVVHKNYFSHL